MDVLFIYLIQSYSTNYQLLENLCQFVTYSIALLATHNSIQSFLSKKSFGVYIILVECVKLTFVASLV